ncbi:MAG: EAL domain-containing protein, partial [Mariprofundaceae bacterium]
PNGELVMPDIFLPLAEETGQIIDIGAWVISTACHQLREWHDQGYQHSIAVNLSARQFESNDLIWQLTQALEASGVDASFLDLEVTETCAMADPEKTIRVLTSMRGLGVKVSIDDFGTGYSSLSYLKKLPVNTLKIDRAFVRDIPEDSDDIAITTAVTQMASSLGLSIVAEGVENEEQRAFLDGIGCEQAQGYYFSRPLPIGEYMTWLKEQESQELEK